MRKLLPFVFFTTLFFACNSESPGEESTDSTGSAETEAAAVDSAAAMPPDTVNSNTRTADSVKPTIISFPARRPETPRR